MPRGDREQGRRSEGRVVRKVLEARPVAEWGCSRDEGRAGDMSCRPMAGSSSAQPVGWARLERGGVGRAGLSRGRGSGGLGSVFGKSCARWF